MPQKIPHAGQMPLKSEKNQLEMAVRKVFMKIP